VKSIVVEVCAGTACHVMGANSLISVLQSLSTLHKDTLVIRLTHCLGNCGQGPNVRVEGKLYSRVDPDKLREIINNYCGQE